MYGSTDRIPHITPDATHHTPHIQVLSRHNVIWRYGVIVVCMHGDVIVVWWCDTVA